MIVQLENNIDPKTLSDIEEKVKRLGYQFTHVHTQYGRYMVCIGKKEIDLRELGFLPGVLDIHRVSDPFKLVSTRWKVGKTQIDLGEKTLIGNGHFQVMAGPCSIESEEQIDSTLSHLKEMGISIMRGGVFKPRSSPYSFRGLGIEGLKFWYEKAKSNNIRIITEVMQVSQIKEMIDFVDIFQVGARNSQNFNLLDALGELDKPVLIKRGMSGTIEELLQSAEYIFSNGNEKIILCERGIRTYENAYRNTMDINAIAILKDRSHLPVVADPSHGIGVRKYVDKIALASVVSGADGIIMEVHECPEKAISDGQQTLDYSQSSQLIQKIRKARELVL
ncbi:MAG TPA: 3-deoxy-7-phosphoheptulonate synthase [Saprospiraceae bacterium]|nr:3-deoxy-7-phosphoheptulonate synthase [Saprospiraceae bacterium]